jgi:hypothetical protein
MSIDNNVCFYTSIGDDLSLINYIASNYTYKIICNYYGTNDIVFSEIQKIAQYAEKNRLSKFQSLKKIYHQNIKNKYQYIHIYDDDALIKGDLNCIIHIMNKYHINICSPCHDSKGKISHRVHIKHNGAHIFRKVNFIEMNFPTFNTSILDDFMNIYSENVSGWGIDIWYSQLYDNFGIVDNVCVHNPNRNGASINKLYSTRERISQWIKYKNIFNLKDIDDIKPRTLEFVKN